MNTIHITAKCSDACFLSLRKDNKEIAAVDGYVPKWLPNPTVEHYGDYIELTIDIDTGKIVNWRKPTQAQLKETFGLTV